MKPKIFPLSGFYYRKEVKYQIKDSVAEAELPRELRISVLCHIQ